MVEHSTAISAPNPIWALSTDSFDPGYRFDAWHGACYWFNDIWVSPDKRGEFQAATSYWSLGQLTVTQSSASPLRLFRSSAQAMRDQLDQDVVVAFAAGESLTELKGRQYRLAAGDVAFGNYRNGYDFRIASSGTARWNELICPPEVRDRLGELGSGAHASGDEQTPQSRLLGQFICSVSRRLPELAVNDLPLIEQALLCLLAAAKRELSGPARLSDVGRHTVDRAQAVAAIERELFSARLTADRVCEVTGISRSSLYRLFEVDNGVANYIRMRRLDALRSDLVDPRKRSQSVVQLAEGRGFHSHSTLSRAFRRRFGCTPGEVRSGQVRPFVSSDAAENRLCGGVSQDAGAAPEDSDADNARAVVFLNGPKNGHSADTNETPQAGAERGFV